uniref:Uncharacterized protein n=1 Tax=Picea sitchensis TaxID=3332 RepID=A9NM16_PICSI|nr:unknown [Picea sitchensis]
MQGFSGLENQVALEEAELLICRFKVQYHASFCFKVFSALSSR